MLLNNSIVAVCTVVTKARWIIFERANILKIVIFPRNDKFRIFLIFITFWSFVIWSKNLFSFSSFLLYEKNVPKILIALISKLTHSTPQSAFFTPFLTPIPATSNFDLLNWRAENWDVMLKLLKISVADFSLCKKQWYLQRMQCIESHYYRHETFDIRVSFYCNECYF